MAIRDATRKVLWSLAGNQCARCQAQLVGADNSGTPHAIIGQECHIVARSKDGPRGADGERSDLDGYENLILLCANCHVIVDAHPAAYPPQALRQLKTRHEAAVSARKVDEPPRLTLTGRDVPVLLKQMTSGDELMGLLAPSLSFRHEVPDDLSKVERSAVAEFLQDCADWSDIVNDLGPKGFYDGAESVQGHLEQLADMELLALAGTQPLTLSGGVGAPVNWPEVVLKILRMPAEGGSDRAA